jgi:hypothetical protein
MFLSDHVEKEIVLEHVRRLRQDQGQDEEAQNPQDRRQNQENLPPQRRLLPDPSHEHALPSTQ